MKRKIGIFLLIITLLIVCCSCSSNTSDNNKESVDIVDILSVNEYKLIILRFNGDSEKKYKLNWGKGVTVEVNNQAAAETMSTNIKNGDLFFVFIEYEGEATTIDVKDIIDLNDRKLPGNRYNFHLTGDEIPKETDVLIPFIVILALILLLVIFIVIKVIKNNKPYKHKIAGDSSFSRTQGITNIPNIVGNYDVFISYKSSHDYQANLVYEYLNNHNIKTFICSKNITAGADYPTVLSNVLKKSKVVVLIGGEQIHQSEFVKTELKISFDNNIPIIVYKIEEFSIDSSIKRYISNTQFINSCSKPNAKLDVLLNTINREIR